MDGLQVHLLAAIIAACGRFAKPGADQDIPPEDRIGDLEIPFVLDLVHREKPGMGHGLCP